ncbi:MAG: preprotein translocase subunit SecY [Candidatus Diapherotrites archaeon]|nr:preprotein translocase subunit SecY [Candidatus Diapherotrites archaeon]
MTWIDQLEPLYSRVPSVKTPAVAPNLMTKLKWTAVILLVFFVLGEIKLIGISAATAGRFAQFQMILASNMGTLLTAGIGPIVIASLVLQLMVGAKILPLDMSNPMDRAKFMGLNRLFAIIMCIIEPLAYVMGGMLAPAAGPMFLGINLNIILITAQVAAGSLILLYLDDICGKYGIGSGIGLFIAAGVSGAIFWRILNPFTGTGAVWFMAGSAPQGLGWAILYYLTQASFSNIILAALPIIFTLIVFLIVAYAEGIHVDIPVTSSMGFGTRFPIKFLYSSNLPVIFAVMLFANIQLLALMAQGTPLDPWIGHYQNGQLVSGFAFYTNAPYGYVLNLVQQAMGATAEELGGISTLSLGSIAHVIGYFILMTVTATAFGLLWLEISGTGPKTLAEQLHSQGQQIAGYRRDPRILENVLRKYIPPSAFLGSAAVGMLAAGADIIGCLSSGTGILLTVGIVYRFYEDLRNMQAQEQNPMLAKILK